MAMRVANAARRGAAMGPQALRFLSPCSLVPPPSQSRDAPTLLQPSHFSTPPQAVPAPSHFSACTAGATRFLLPPACGSAIAWREMSSGASGGVASGDVGPSVAEEESHEDFRPQVRAAEVQEGGDVQRHIEQTVQSFPVVVFMKGLPAAPMCGFSAAVVRLLSAYGVEFKGVNVLEDEELRQGVKVFSQWPTIPQVYVNGEFIGGCDILIKMHQDGELEGVLKDVPRPAQ